MLVYHWAVFEANLNPVVGSEQSGIRSVLVVSNEEYNQTMPMVTVMPLTSTPRDLYPSEIRLPEGKAGQPLESIILAHQVSTISKQRLGKLLGYLKDDEIRNQIAEAVKEHFEIE